MQVKAVTAPVMRAPVLYAAASQAPTGTALIIEDCEDTLKKIEVNCYNCNKQGHMARDCRLPKKNKGMGASMTTEIKKICQEMMVKRNKKPVDFQYRKQLTDNPRGFQEDRQPSRILFRGLGQVATRRQ